ncbi:putative vacuolar protein-sorting-associated protein 36 protein [Lasiodiplodia theobromae]|uniref:Vacuolar protein-sorting-associated protein 36 n=1 Tax=Lasiodiplodia theobromae TaxID=45133 RepID=A0A5N5DRX4_9PEZI|nr:Vacuolar protein-sorting-associated protein 36 protein [Lasiodiplodia theobromae]KAB2580675.1 Vacuolar protein-sorting-associated protein 36 [Lasiodiplodia theobromae]KAF4541051.1 Vacuolar protein-sorting-associated protein 36 protein [Lasiodiplodia theobromae]KAF9632413.1 putative vacuolar protein-sorting-associated protein 36 protein [Lasiodiplodia theobromae]
MFLHRLDLTTALRPELLPDETLLFVQDAVGLYEGKYKIPDYQDGHAYLTSHRVCYVDNKEPRKFSVAVNLKDVERPEFYAGFLKSSPKVTVYPKPNKRPNLAATRSPAPSSGDLPIRNKAVGIGGLERRGIEQRQNNEIMIGSAFEDLEALMTSAKEIIALAEQFASQANLNGNGNSEADAALAQSASALGLVTTKDMLGSGSDTLYISELSRNLAEFLTDDRKGILKREGGIMSLVDLWAVFNRARGGVELVSPTDFEKAAQMWDKLKLPVRLRRFKSGLLVVQGRDRTDEKTIASLLSWLQELHTAAPPGEAGWDWETYGRGVTAQEAAEWFGWSVGVATEELEMAEEKGVLCREQGLDGIKFWENWIVQLPRVEDAAGEE